MSCKFVLWPLNVLNFESEVSNSSSVQNELHVKIPLLQKQVEFASEEYLISLVCKKKLPVKLCFSELRQNFLFSLKWLVCF